MIRKLILIICILALIGCSHDIGMEEAFNKMGDYRQSCRDAGYDNSAQFNDDVYCKHEVNGTIVLTPIDNK